MKKIFRSIFSYCHQTDGWLWLLGLTLSGFSAVLLSGMVYSGIWDIKPRTVLVQIFACGLGIICAVILSKFDYHTLCKLWKLHVPIGYLFVLLTFVIGIGAADRPEDRSWIEIPFTNMTIQPTEFLKIVFILVFSLHLFTVKEDLNRLPTLLLVCLHGAIPILLIHFQGDDGTALVFAFIFVSMVFAAGLSWKYIAAALGAIPVAVPLLWFFVLNDFQKQRFLILLNPSAADAQGDYYQQYWAKLAIGSGRVWGKGIFIENHRYIPEAYNDFIFSFIGESLGFVGCLATIVALTALCVKILNDANRAEDLQGRLICVGVFAMFACQAVVNIGMCLSLLPVIGITLPFLSSGGSSVLANYLGLGLVLSVYMRTPKTLFSN